MIFTIYGNAERQRVDDLVAVPENLAPWALVAPPIWLIVHRLWWPLAFYLLFVMFTMAVSTTSFALVSMVLSWLPGVYLMLEGRELYRRKLRDGGRELVGIVNADDEDEAITRHVMRENLDISIAAGGEAGSENGIGKPIMGRRPVSQSPAAAAGMFGLFSPEET